MLPISANLWRSSNSLVTRCHWHILRREFLVVMVLVSVLSLLGNGGLLTERNCWQTKRSFQNTQLLTDTCSLLFFSNISLWQRLGKKRRQTNFKEGAYERMSQKLKTTTQNDIVYWLQHFCISSWLYRNHQKQLLSHDIWGTVVLYENIHKQNKVLFLLVWFQWLPMITGII